MRKIRGSFKLAKRCLVLLSLTALASVIATPAFAGVVDCGTLAGNLVTNCGFETGDLTGWGLFGDTSYSGVNYNPLVHSGVYAMDFGSVSGVGYLIQDIPTVVGNAYHLEFWLANDGGTPTSFAVSWNFVTLFSESNASGYGYTDFDFPGLAPSSDAFTRLQFSVKQVPAWYHLDDVQVTAPEPGTLLAMLIGGLGIGLANRWKRRKAC